MSKLPDMSREEEAEFWKTHDSTDFLDSFQKVTVTRGKRPEHKCAHCEKRLLSRYVDVEVASGWVVMRQLRELYCPDAHESRLTPEAQRLVPPGRRWGSIEAGQYTLDLQYAQPKNGGN